uniref:Uncharacterized protein n=1 Tax=Anguilla anguilla TaxID=7936 RepID=A0A0E9QE00_ANGAN
MTIQKKRIH